MASKEDIIALPNQQLRRPSKKVAVVNEDVLKVIEDMKSATLDWEDNRKHELGVALAAVQIGQPYKIIVVRNNFEDKSDRKFNVFINPEITKLEGDVVDDFEGCLSIRDIYGKVPRYSKIRLQALDENGQLIRLRAEGFLARVLQHEVDHIKGKVFIDHIKEQKEAFFKLNNEGGLDQLDYDGVKSNSLLW